jgi:uncharacterized low-complexity protein
MATKKTSIALAAGAALTAGMALSPMTAGAGNFFDNPFASSEMSAGYMQVAEAKCGEAKCGGDKKS